MAKELHCPNCNQLTTADRLTYDPASGDFVCPACRPVTSSKPPLAHAKKSHVNLIVTLSILAAIITTLAILLSRSTPKPEDEQRAWDQAHHDEIIALKSQAEALAIAGKLPESHAKYREIEKLIGGRQVKEPTLFDMVEVARQDQDRIYKLLLAKMEQKSGTATQPARDTSSERPPPVTTPFKFASPQPPAQQPAAIVQATPLPPPSFPASTSEPALPERAATTAETPATTPATETAPSPRVRSDVAQSLDYPRGPVSDAQVGDAIQKSVDFLLSHFQNGEVVAPDTSGMKQYGIDALCVYALAASSQAIVDQRLSPKAPEMDAMLERLKNYKLIAGADSRAPVTYARSLRACALAMLNRPQDRAVLEDDVAWLIHDATEGAYTYDDRFSPAYVPRVHIQRSPATKPAPANSSLRPRSAALSDGVLESPRASAQKSSAPVILTDGVFTPRPPQIIPPPPRIFTNKLPSQSNRNRSQSPYKSDFPWDNSNSQYGLLGVWAGAEVGCEVPDNYWRLVQKHWEGCQLPSGEWNYLGDEQPGYFAMTVAGVASLLVTHDYLEAPLLNTRVITARPPYSVALSAGLAWLEDGDNAINPTRPPVFYLGYNLYGMERVGLASGFKQFGGHDWFIELASKTLPTQFANGAFGDNAEGFDALVDTSYVLLFLSRGRHPIMMNKLRYDGQWTNRPRDIANLTNYTAREMERPLNWQVVDITRESSNWQDAPILFISGNKTINLSDNDLAKLSDFVDNGGILFTHSDLGSAEFNKFAMDLSKRLFPLYGPLKDLPPDHPIYSVNYPLPLPHPRLQGVSNGARLLMIHSPIDISNAWQVRASLSRKEQFQLGANIYFYSTGKERFRNRLDTTVVPPADDAPLRTVGLARVKYDGNYNPEPGAWPRFSRILQWQTGVKLDPKDVPIEQLDVTQTPLAHITGTAPFTPTESQLAALSKYIESGGCLLIDSAGGNATFADAQSTWLPKLLKDQKLAPVSENDPLLKQSIEGTVDVPATKTLRLYALEQLRNEAPRLKFVRVGKGKIVYTSLDIVSALLGTDTWGILGYQPEYSEALVKNWVLTSAP